MGGRGDDIGVRNRARVSPAGDEAGEVRHIDQVDGADLVGDVAELGPVGDPGVRRVPGDDQLRPVLMSEATHLVHVDHLGFGIEAVSDDVEQLPGEVDRGSVGEVPSLVESHPEDGVTGFDDGEIGSQVRLGSGVGLHVGMVRAEQILCPLDGETFDLVDDLAALVVPPPRVALGVLVGEDRPDGLHRSERGEVLRGDEIDVGPLPVGIAPDEVGEHRICLRERRHVGHGDLPGR